MKLVIKTSKPPDFSMLFELRDVACMIAKDEEQQKVAFSGKKRAAPSCSCCGPDKKFRSSDEGDKLHGWMESVTRMCSTLPSPLVFGLKRLTTTDVKAQSNRFLFPFAVRVALWREMRECEKRKAGEGEGLPVSVLDRLGRKHRVVLANWPKNHWLVLKGKNYRRFVEANELEEKLQEKVRQRLELTVGIWVFRSKEDDALCFALVESE